MYPDPVEPLPSDPIGSTPVTCKRGFFRRHWKSALVLNLSLVLYGGFWFVQAVLKALATPAAGDDPGEF